MLVDNINRTFTPMLLGVYPSKLPLRLLTSFVISSETQHLIAVSFKIGSGLFTIMKSLNTDGITLTASIEQGVPRITFSCGGQDSFNVSWNNEVRDSYASFLIQIGNSMFRAYSFENLVVQQPLELIESYDMVLFNFTENNSRSIFSMFRVLQGTFSDTDVEDLINKGFLNEKYSTLEIKKRCQYDFNQSTLNFNRWYSTNRQNYLYSDQRINYATGFAGSHIHEGLVGYNPYNSTHKPAVSSSISYSNKLTRELIVNTITSDSNTLRIRKFSFNQDNTKFYQTIEQFNFGSRFTVVLYCCPSQSNDIFSIGDYHFREVAFDNDWKIVIIDVDTLINVATAYINSSVVNKNITNPKGIITLNKGAGSLMFFRVYQNTLTSEERDVIFNNPLHYDDSQLVKLCEFDDTSITSQTWSDKVSGFSAYSSTSIQVLIDPSVYGVGKVNYKSPYNYV